MWSALYAEVVVCMSNAKSTHVGVSVCCELLILLNMAHTYGFRCMQKAVE